MVFTPELLSNVMSDISSILWITIINYGYLEYTQNFLLSMKRTECSFKLLVFCLDKPTMDALAAFDNCVCINAQILKEINPRFSSYTENFSVWGEEDYLKIVFTKLDALYYTLRETLGLGCKAVGYLDTDMFYLSDPTTIVLDLMHRNESIDVFCQCDEEFGHVSQCSKKHRCPFICSGIIVFRNDPLLYPCFQYSPYDIFNYTGDQAYLYAKLKAMDVVALTVQKTVFMNGSYLMKYWNETDSPDPVPIPPETSLVHFNYMIGSDKKKNMIRQNMWLISSPDPGPDPGPTSSNLYIKEIKHKSDPEIKVNIFAPEPTPLHLYDSSVRIAKTIKRCSLRTWQQHYKHSDDLIVQASAKDGSDAWQPFPIGMSWQYVLNHQKGEAIQLGEHSHLLLCAIAITDWQRRPKSPNREFFLRNLTQNGFQNHSLEHSIYFDSLPNHKFVVSPEGNGVDCHRHYEALVAGCIPIMEKNPLVETKYANLPILWTTDYSEITPEFLTKKYEEMLDQPYDFSALFMDYYDINTQNTVRDYGNYWINKLTGVWWYK